MPNPRDDRQRGERALRRSGRNSSQIEELRDELQRIDTSGQFTSGLRSARPSTGGVANSRYFETDTRWVYLWNGVAWSNIGGIFIGTDADRTGISISATDNGALALTHTSNIYKFYRIESGAWVEKILDVDDEQAQDIVAALLADGDVNFTYNDAGATITNVVEKVQGIPYSTTDPTLGQLFTFDGSQMSPVDPSTLGGAGGLVVSGSAGDGKIVVYDGVTDNRAEWFDDVRVIVFEFGDGNSAGAIVANQTAVLPKLAIDITITAARIIGDVSGSAVVNIQKATYSAYGTLTNICASAKPTLSSAIKNEDSTLTGWTTTLSAGDVLVATLESVSTCKKVAVALTVKRRTA